MPLNPGPLCVFLHSCPLPVLSADPGGRRFFALKIRIFRRAECLFVCTRSAMTVIPPLVVQCLKRKNSPPLRPNTFRLEGFTRNVFFQVLGLPAPDVFLPVDVFDVWRLTIPPFSIPSPPPLSGRLTRCHRVPGSTSPMADFSVEQSHAFRFLTPHQKLRGVDLRLPTRGAVFGGLRLLTCCQPFLYHSIFRGSDPIILIQNRVLYSTLARPSLRMSAACRLAGCCSLNSLPPVFVLIRHLVSPPPESGSSMG